MRQIVITGASGFIGRKSLQEFQTAGWQTTGLSRRPISSLSNLLQQDLSRPFSSAVTNAIAHADVVLHAAARSSPWGSRRQFFRDNILATRQLLESCRRNGYPKLIYVSSSSVYYREHDQILITEDCPQASPAVNRYAHSKQLAEQLVRSYEGPWMILRPRAVYGPGDTVLFPRILAAARAGRLPLLVRPGSPVIGDLIFIDNLTHIFLKAAEAADIVGEFNLTDNHPVPVLEFLLRIFDELDIARPGRHIDVRSAMRMATLIETAWKLCCPWKEPPITRFGVHVFAWSKTFDVSRMVNTFGPPAISPQQGVRQFVDWIRAEDPYT